MSFRDGGEGEEALVGALMIARFLMDSSVLARKVVSFLEALKRVGKR